MVPPLVSLGLTPPLEEMLQASKAHSSTTTNISFCDKRLVINIKFVTIYILFVTIFFLDTNIIYNRDKTKKISQ